jgi:hypothetical protein
MSGISTSRQTRIRLLTWSAERTASIFPPLIEPLRSTRKMYSRACLSQHGVNTSKEGTNLGKEAKAAQILELMSGHKRLCTLVRLLRVKRTRPCTAAYQDLGSSARSRYLFLKVSETKARCGLSWDRTLRRVPEWTLRAS